LKEVLTFKGRDFNAASAEVGDVCADYFDGLRA
jgi:hypothetical protein